ncbi:MAG: HAD-IIB family hydrolase [Candidatus Paceibacterota bacterium]|jgi:hypothetical protein
MLNKKIVAFDLDGTLTESRQPLSKEIARVLAILVAQKKVAVISGGSYCQFQKQFLPSWIETVSGLSLEKAHELNTNLFLLPTSGSQIYGYDQGKDNWQILVEEKFPVELRKKVKKVLVDLIISNDYDIPVESYGDKIEDRGTQITFSALGQEAPLDKKKVWDSDQKKRLKIKAWLEKKIPEVEISVGGETSIDILPKGLNKAVGLQKLLNLLSQEKGDLIFVGDALFPGGNDYSVHEAGFETIRVGGPQEARQFIEDLLKRKIA